MNLRDSEAILALLEKAGFNESSELEDADVLILNTCSVRDSADRKVEGYLWQLREWKEKRANRILAVIGCMAQSRGNSLLTKFPHLDIVCGTFHFGKIVEMIYQVANEHLRICDISEFNPPYDDLSTHLLKNKISAFIPIVRGCSMKCSYCIVPDLRGAEISRPQDEIIREAKTLAEQGIKEIFLLGQNIAAYGLEPNSEKCGKSPFAELLAKIAEIDKIKRIRFTSPHPANFNDALINAICEIRKVCDAIHIPLQSGSDKILDLMRRRYSSNDYMKIIEKLKTGKKGVSFSTDVIVGFPGENDTDFNATRTVLENVGFDQEFIFKYSKRKNTPAANMMEQVEDKVKKERNHCLLEDLKTRVLKRNKSLEGSTFDILIEAESQKSKNRMIGRTSSNKTVIVEKKDNIKIGDFTTALIEDSTVAALYGRIVG